MRICIRYSNGNFTTVPVSQMAAVSFVADSSMTYRTRDGRYIHYLTIYEGANRSSAKWAKNPFFGTEGEVQEVLRRTWALFKAGVVEFDYYEGPLSLASIQGKFDIGKELEDIIANLDVD